MIPDPGNVIEWDVDQTLDVTLARKLYELTVIRKLQLLYNRGDLPSLNLWVNHLINSDFVQITYEVLNILQKLEENDIEIELLPYSWAQIIEGSKKLNNSISHLIKKSKDMYYNQNDVLFSAWAIFELWSYLRQADIPIRTQEIFNHGPSILLSQVQMKKSLYIEFAGLINLANLYSEFRSIDNKFTNNVVILLLLRYSWNYCHKLVEVILTFVNRSFILKDDGKYFKTNGVPYLFNDIGFVKLLLNPPGYKLPYDLSNSSGRDRLSIHISIFDQFNASSGDIFNEEIKIIPEQERLRWILSNVIDALKRVKTNNSFELGYLIGLTETTYYENVSEIWNSFIYNSLGLIHQEIQELDQCFSDESLIKQINQLLVNLENKQNSLPNKIPLLLDIKTPESSKYQSES